MLPQHKKRVFQDSILGCRIVYCWVGYYEIWYDNKFTTYCADTKTECEEIIKDKIHLIKAG